MSYSRWTNSRFFTYWDTAQYADKNQLRVDAGDFTALLSYSVCKAKPRELAAIFAKTLDEERELVDIFARFCRDVEHDTP